MSLSLLATPTGYHYHIHTRYKKNNVLTLMEFKYYRIYSEFIWLKLMDAFEIWNSFMYHSLPKLKD